MSPRVQQDADYGNSLHHDPDFKGPRRNRSCTDIICLLFFIIAMVAWIIIGKYAYQHGDLDRLLVPADSDGRRCGLDSDVKKKPFLFFFDLTKCANISVLIDGCSTTQICVEECPLENWTAMKYTSGLQPFDKEDIKKNIICKTDKIVEKINSLEKLKSVIDNELCAPWQIRSSPVYKRCVPSFRDIHDAVVSMTSAHLSEEALQNSTEVINALSTVNEVKERVVEDLIYVWRYLLIGLFLSMFVCLIYITLLRWIAGLVVWLSLLGIVGLLSFATYFCFNTWQYLSQDPDHTLVNPKGRALRGKLNEILNKPSTWMVLLIISVILLLLTVVILIFLRARIRIAIALIKEGSKAVGSVISSLFFPVFPWIFQLVCVLYFIYIAFLLTSIGRNTFKVHGLNSNNSNCVCKNGYKNGDMCEVDVFQRECTAPGSGGPCVLAGCRFFQQESESFITYFQLYNLFSMLWTLSFFSGVAKMILAGTFATWYWTFKKRDLPFFTLTESIYRTLRFHLGTVAFGSLLIAICNFIRALIEFAETKLKKYDNFLTKAILCCFRCFFWCLHKFLCFISTNAYIMCSIHGKGFCTSAQDAFSLLMRNVVRVVVVDKVTDFLLFLGKLVVTASMMIAAFYVFHTDELRLLDNSGRDVKLNYFLLPVALIGLGTYLISSIFFSVYATAVDTLFLCFLEDCERNDGSIDRPFFMSKRLMKILGKKNKKPKHN